MTAQAPSPSFPSRTARRLAAYAAALSAGAFLPVATAAIITFNTPISIPNTFAGVYINLATGANGITPASVPGWDFGPWGSASTLAFFFPGTPANTSGAVAVSATGPYVDLPAGSVISSASTFSTVTATTATLAFQSTGNHVLGFRFFNETTSAVNYGYMWINTTGPLGFPATITSWSFENTGGAIVPEPATAVLMSLGALALGALDLRRRRRQQPAA